jgi:hypothetical protein
MRSIDIFRLSVCVKKRYFLLFDQKQLVKPNVFGVKLIRWFAEVLSERGHGVQVNPNRRVSSSGSGDLPASVVEVGSRRNSFRCDDTTK